MYKLGLSILALALTATTAQAVQTRTFEGKVKSVDGQKITLDVAGETIKLSGNKQQLSQVKKGQVVQIEATPDLQASKVDPIQGSFAGNQLVGTVESVHQNSATIKTLDGQTETVRIDSKMLEQVKQGQQVVVELKENPMEAKNWRVTQVQPATPAPGQAPQQQPPAAQPQQRM